MVSSSVFFRPVLLYGFHVTVFPEQAHSRFVGGYLLLSTPCSLLLAAVYLVFRFCVSVPILHRASKHTCSYFLLIRLRGGPPRLAAPKPTVGKPTDVVVWGRGAQDL